MRIIAGKNKGKRLKSPQLSKGKRVRPLSSQVREALFNILQHRIEGAGFLDLFAGTGAVGIEALSRGAKIAFFVERDKRIVELIRENLADSGFTEQSEVYALPVDRALKILVGKGAQFDLIFLGAPYDDPALEDALELIGGSSLVNTGGIVIAEYRAKHVMKESFGPLAKFRENRYGDTMLSFYKAN